MKGFKTQKRRQRDDDYEDRKPKNKLPKRVKELLDPLRLPNEVELRLFDAAIAEHERHKLSIEANFGRAKFEVCEHESCVETRRVLNIKGFLHRFDDPVLKQQPDPERDEFRRRARANRLALQEYLQRTQ